MYLELHIASAFSFLNGASLPGDRAAGRLDAKIRQFEKNRARNGSATADGAQTSQQNLKGKRLREIVVGSYI